MPTVHYFHELADPFSHLAVQKFDELRSRYNLAFEVHLTSPQADAFRGDATRYPDWALRDAASVADGYQVDFPSPAVQPSEDQVHAAAEELAPVLKRHSFAHDAVSIGDALWRGDYAATPGLAARPFESGNRLRAALGHYAGGMFWFDGEWYWGLDRLERLEERLVEEGFGCGAPSVARPRIETSTVNGGGLCLEVFPSLRSPYTAISFDRTLAIADRTGIQLKIRPVMPMMMRGVPAPRQKGIYILFDAAREARALDIPFGKIVDPFGEPVRQAYSLYPAVVEGGLERQFVSRYLRAAWAEGVDITQPAGLKQVIEDIGLGWSDVRPRLGTPDVDTLLEDNVADMLEAGLWGVPSFRVTGGSAPPFSCWGQDRLWRVEQEIMSRATDPTNMETA